MKTFVVIAMLAVAGMVSACRKNECIIPEKCGTGPYVNPSHPMKDSLQAIINRYIAKGIPGIQVAVKNSKGLYITQGGFASVEEKTTFRPGDVSWLFSITKTYTAALTMKEKEKGIIDLDANITRYLPTAVSAGIKGSGKLTVRMLLNHSSGLIEFTSLPEYLAGQFNHPLEQPSIEDILQMVYGKDLISEPGAVFNYCNTNYLLLHVILEKATGKTYAELLKKAIIGPLNLQHTYYDLAAAQLNSLGFPNYYFDPNSSGQLQNATPWNNALGNACYGWGGIAATASDVILFYEALMQKRVVSDQSLNEMKKWFHSEGSAQPEYGLGIEYYQYAEGSTPQMGHEGDGIGCSTMILYVPANNTYLYINCTAGRKLEGPYLFKITDFKNEISRYVAGWRK